MPFRFVALALLATSLSLAGAAHAQKPTKDPLIGLDAYIQDGVTKFKGVGLAIAVVKGDSVVYAKGFGVKKLGDPAPVTPRTVFAVGSTTKAFTTAALGMLVDEGRFGWDTRATDLLKGFELADPAVTRELTVRDMVTHRSGLSRGDRLWMGSRYSRAEVIRRVRFHKPTWSLRTTFGYQNIMYLAAGELIPATTGRSWDDFIRDRIFQPLGMTSSTTTVRDLAKLPDVATPHATINGTLKPIEYRQIDNIGPAGSINSTVLDMAQWIRFHLNGGTVGGRPLLSAATHRELFITQMPMRVDGSEGFLYPGANFLGYGLGWFLFDHAGKKVAEHSGGIDGMITELMMVPSEKLGVIVLSNSGSSIAAFPIARGVLNRFLGVDQDPVATMVPLAQAMEQAQKKAEDSVTKARVLGKGPSQSLSAYTGIFDNPMYGPARVLLENGRLVAAVDALEEPIDLEQWHYDTFRGTSRDLRLGNGWVVFKIGSDGSVQSLTVEGLEQDFVRRPAAVIASSCDAGDPDRFRLTTRPSPYDSTAISLGAKTAKLCYSRPSMRGRVVFGSQLVPFDTLWRTGANDPTTIHLPVDATIAGLKVPAGSYSIFTVPGRNQWQVVINRSLVGAAYNDEIRAKELGRATVAAEALTEPVETFTIRSATTGATAADLILEWEKTRVRIPITVARP